MTQTQRLQKLTQFLALLMCGLVPFAIFMGCMTIESSRFMDESIPHFSVLVGLEVAVIFIGALSTLALVLSGGRSYWGRSTARLLFLFATVGLACQIAFAGWAIWEQWSVATGSDKAWLCLFLVSNTVFCTLLIWLSLRAVDLLRGGSDTETVDGSIYYIAGLAGLFFVLSAARALVTGVGGTAIGLQISGAGLWVCGYPGAEAWNVALFLAGLFLFIPNRTAEIAAYAIVLLIVVAVPMALVPTAPMFLGFGMGIPFVFGTVLLATLGAHLMYWLGCELKGARMGQHEALARELADF